MNARTVALLALGLWLFATADLRAQNDDVVSQEGFGAAVAIANGDILVGESLNKRVSGRVYVFRKDSSAGSWTDVQFLQPPAGQPDNGFGTSISASGELAAVTSAGEVDDSIYVFRRSADSSWVQDAVLYPADATFPPKTGARVSVSGERVFATAVDTGGVPRVVIFERTRPDGGWIETGNVELPSMEETRWPMSIAASGDRAFVGTPGLAAGAVFVVRRVEQGWNVTKILQGASGEAEQRAAFGASLAVADGRLFVGSPGSNGGVGSVFVFAPDGAGGFQTKQRLTAFGDGAMPHFGSVISASGGSVMIGAYDDRDETGTVYVFAADTAGRFEPVQQIIGDTEEESNFASAIAIGENVALVGAKLDLFDYGSVFVYGRKPNERHWQLASRLKPKIIYQLASIEDGRVNCEGGKAAEFDCEGVDILSFVSNHDLGLSWGMQTNDVWGWTDPESGKEYAIVCTMEGTTFVDVSDPIHPIVLGELPMTEGTRANWWRDAKTYKNYVYIVADNVGNHGLQIFDLTKLRHVENPPVTFKPTAFYDGFGSAHNIVINEASGFAYVVGISEGGQTCGGGAHILDLHDPLSPKFVGCYGLKGTGQTSEGYTHDAQCVIYHGPDERYIGREICFEANENAIGIVDFTDKSNVVPIAVGRYPNVSYAHQGWLSDDQRYYFEDDETDEINGLTDGTRTMVWDVGQLDDPVLIDQHVSSDRATDHNHYVKGSYMYQSNYVSGLRVLDVSNPQHIRNIGYLDTMPWGEDRPGYGGSWSNYPFFKSGTIVVGSLEEGVFFLKKSDALP